MSQEFLTASASTSASASTLTSITTNSFSISSVQKEDIFEKKVLEMLKYLPKLNRCNQIK